MYLTAHAVICKMKAVFARHGIPKELVSDHVPFASAEMRELAASWGIKLIHSSPGYPQSNGLAERMVKTVKHALKKASQTDTDPHLALLALRNTPVTGTDVSPAQVLMGRVLRSTLPCSTAVLQPVTPLVVKGVHARLTRLQTSQEHNYNRNSQPLPEFAPGATVHMETRRGWMPATVVNKREEPRSYNVKTPSGIMLRRNRRHLRRIHPSLHREGDPEPLEQHANPQRGPTELQEHPAQHSTFCEYDSSSFVTPTGHTRSGRMVVLPARYQDFEMSQH